MTREINTIIRSPDDLSCDFLTNALGRKVVGFSCDQIGTGQVGECHRVQLEYEAGATGPATAVLKLAASGTLSRGSGWKLGIYERESRFYAELAPILGSSAIADCYHTFVNEAVDSFYVLLEDIQPAVVGNELKGASLEEARLALRALGELQRASLKITPPKWLDGGMQATQQYLQQLWQGFTQRYHGRVKPEHQGVVDKFLACFDQYISRIIAPECLKCVSHGDYRLDNMLFRQESGKPLAVTVVDWQTLGWGPVFRDLAFFMGISISPELRRAHDQELIQVYYEALGPNPPFTIDECLQGIREQSFLGLPMAFASPMILEQTDRGDEMFLTMLDRLATYILDLNAVELLPAPAPLAPLAVDPQSEASHPPGKEPLYNESWYFDVADVDQGIGVWVRLGVTPNQLGSWYNALICGPGRPTIAVVDFETPTPGPELVINSSHIKATHTPEIPLEQYRVTLIGRGESFDDPADLLRAEDGGKRRRGKPVSVHIDLTWQTSGTPYQWRMTPRYEIPCTVSGTVLVDQCVTTFAKAPGQRDHSWGVRDWWSLDWMWSAVHLDDGTHLHGVEARTPAGSLSIGYIQSPTIPIAELDVVKATEQIGSDGLPRVAIINYTSESAASKLVLHVKPMGHGPVRLDSPDGRVTFFPRLWAAVETQDGRRGVGWFEWNLCQDTQKA